ncbi:putative dynamin GTPase [Mariannaea sp. PMI_226]|nr:putative dynamin GTPase [Mariannaea sp. PMI_226]
MAVSIDTELLNQLNTEEARSLHEITIGLSASGVGNIVNLPQIIVVGEQSSGKSSVLEAISRMRFPVSDGICTRFATELVLRHGKETRVDISVKFADPSKSSTTFQKTGFKEDDLPGLIQEARELMGHSRDNRDFSKDVLRLEIDGPKVYPLTLVDLPGFFQTETDSQTFQGMAVVNELVESYMRQENSIILAVVDANKPLASQVALRKVKEHDPERERTIGVITKPDLNQPGYSYELNSLKLARNEEEVHRLKLGWHVLRNRGEKELDLDKRDAIEDAFFSSGAWNSIRPEDRGVTSLRKKLSKVLFRHIGNSLPTVVEEIERKHQERQDELDKLGDLRDTVQKKRSFLIDVASKFQRLARDGIEGRYKDVFFGGMQDQNRKLRAQLRNFNQAFDYTLTVKGSARVIGRKASLFSDFYIPPPSTHLGKFLERYPYHFDNPRSITWEDLNKELQEQASINQGSELPGLPNKDLAIQLFQNQAQPWEGIAKRHLEHITNTTQSFVDELFTDIMGQPEIGNATDAVLRNCVDTFFAEKKLALQSKLDELLRPYAKGYAFPLDADFHQNASQKSLGRLADQLVNAIQVRHPDVFDETSKSRLSRAMISDAITNKKDMVDGEFGTEKIIEMMEVYYEMSRQTFTENVINLAAESCLICDIPNILTPQKVGDMEEKELNKLAVEPDDVKSRRAHLTKEIAILCKGRDVCRKYAPRKIADRPVATDLESQTSAGLSSSRTSKLCNIKRITPRQFSQRSVAVGPTHMRIHRIPLRI